MNGPVLNAFMKGKAEESLMKAKIYMGTST